MSESKDTESGAEAQADTDTEHAPQDDAESANVGEAEAASEGAITPKKKKKKPREPVDPENIRDRNARVRAEAAEKRRSRREREQQSAPRRNLDASEMMDDALARSTHAAANLLTKHFNKVQWLVMAGLVGWIGFEVYTWRHDRNAEKASDTLFKALAAETGKVAGDDTPDMGDARGTPADTRRAFASNEERLKAAKSEYVLASSSGGPVAGVLADLGAAGVAYDLGQYKDAQTGFEKVRQAPTFATDNDIKGRTLEGLGMALEAQKNDDAALKAFHELSNMDGASFGALGLYHQARILKAQGKSDDALKMLEKAGDKLATLKETPGAIKYLGGTVIDLLDTFDPKKAHELSEKLMSSDAAKKMAESAAAGPGGSKMTPEMQRKIQEMMEKIQKETKPAAPGAPAPMPGPVAPQDAPAQDAPPSDTPPPSDAPPDAPAPAPSGAP